MTIAQPQRVTDLAAFILAPNPGPMTLDGTNSYLLSGTGAASVIVVDPGPDDAGHLAALAAAGSGRADPDHPPASRPHRGRRGAGRG